MNTKRFPYEIPVRSYTWIEVLNETTFEIHDFASIFTPYYVPDTADLGTIEAVLADPDWTEDDVNAAVKALNDAEEACCEEEGERVAGSLN